MRQHAAIDREAARYQRAAEQSRADYGKRQNAGKSLDSLPADRIRAIYYTTRNRIAAREGRGEGPNGQESGPFRSLFDFCLRVDRTRINKRTVEALIKAGAFDSLHLNRADLLASLDIAFEYAATTQANAHQGGLFDMLGGPDGEAGHGSSTQPKPAR